MNELQTATTPIKRRPVLSAKRSILSNPEKRHLHFKALRKARKARWAEITQGRPVDNSRPAWTSSATVRREEGPKPFTLFDWTDIRRVLALPLRLPG